MISPGNEFIDRIGILSHAQTARTPELCGVRFGRFDSARARTSGGSRFRLKPVRSQPRWPPALALPATPPVAHSSLATRSHYPLATRHAHSPVEPVPSVFSVS